MKKLLLSIFISLILCGAYCVQAEASLVSNKQYRTIQNKEIKQDVKQIKKLFNTQNIYANKHDEEGLALIYSDNFINNDGYNKEAYFKSIKETWESCKNITYNTKILSITVNGDFAMADVEETATGTISEYIDSNPISGEVHSKSTGIYHLNKINGKWYISGETSITDEASLLYGDARFMNIEINAPAQVFSGEQYTATVKVDADDKTYIVGSIDHDLVTYPSRKPNFELRSFPKSNVLERFIKANTDNINEYAIASLAISKISNVKDDKASIYLSGLASVMKRVNVVPKNNFIKLED